MSKLPHWSDASIPDAKLRYCLDPDHPVGRHKARLFDSALGLGQDDASLLEGILRHGIAAREAQFRGGRGDGTQRWVVELPVIGRLGPLLLTSAWDYDASQRRPRLVSCYLKKVKP